VYVTQLSGVAFVSVQRTYPTPDSGLTHLFHGGGRLVVHCLHSIRLVTPECTRGVIDPLYHSRHNGRDIQYECDRGIINFELQYRI